MTISHNSGNDNHIPENVSISIQKSTCYTTSSDTCPSDNIMLKDTEGRLVVTILGRSKVHSVCFCRVTPTLLLTFIVEVPLPPNTVVDLFLVVFLRIG